MRDSWSSRIGGCMGKDGNVREWAIRMKDEGLDGLVIALIPSR
jgi:hypothetical protein